MNEQEHDMSTNTTDQLISDEHIRTLLLDGMSLSMLSKKYGMSTWTLHDIARRNGLVHQPGRGGSSRYGRWIEASEAPVKPNAGTDSDLSNEQKAEIVARLIAGEKIPACARTYGVSESYTRKIAREAGLRFEIGPNNHSNTGRWVRAKTDQQPASAPIQESLEFGHLTDAESETVAVLEYAKRLMTDIAALLTQAEFDRDRWKERAERFRAGETDRATEVAALQERCAALDQHLALREQTIAELQRKARAWDEHQAQQRRQQEHASRTQLRSTLDKISQAFGIGNEDRP